MEKARDSVSFTGQMTEDESAAQQEDTSLPEEETMEREGSIRDIMFYEQPEADKVCIKVQPSMLRENLFYYYIPEGKDQEWLSAQVAALDLEGQPFAGRWEGHKEKGWYASRNGLRKSICLSGIDAGGRECSKAVHGH